MHFNKNVHSAIIPDFLEVNSQLIYGSAKNALSRDCPCFLRFYVQPEHKHRLHFLPALGAISRDQQ